MSRSSAALAVIALVAAATFAPVREFAFLNWDDDAAIASNGSLTAPGVVQWAFTTTHMEHYQPVSWLVWSAIARTAGMNPAAFHAANLAAHVAAALLVFALARTVLARMAPATPIWWRDVAAVAGASLYAVHPLRVEVVAWVSAFPYALALVLTLVSLLAWLQAAPSKRGWWWAALLLYLASLLARPLALGYPIVLTALDRTVHGYSLRQSVQRVWPFATAALAAAAVELNARAPAMGDVPLTYQVQSALAAPFVYVWRTLAPVALTPLDLLPEHPTVNPMVLVAVPVALGIVAALAWQRRRQQPGLIAGGLCYLALLAPAASLVAGGLQRTADRYTYLPDVVIATGIAAAATAVRSRAARALVAAAAVLTVGAAAVLSRSTAAAWRDSVSLWSRVVDVNADNHVAHYNLALALTADGRTDDAADRYRRVLALAPSHAAARLNLDRLEAVRLERGGNAAAARGDLRGAVEHYSRAVALDAQRTHAHAGLGMALAAQGRATEAIPALRMAVGQGARDPSVSNTLAGLLIEAGNPREARGVLEAALAVHQNDVGLAHNLARLLATDRTSSAADAAVALRLATAVANTTRQRDPRVLDTLAAALARNGRLREAAEASDRAAALAAAQGDVEMAVQIKARSRAYRASGPP